MLRDRVIEFNPLEKGSIKYPILSFFLLNFPSNLSDEVTLLPPKIIRSVKISRHLTRGHLPRRKNFLNTMQIGEGRSHDINF